MSKLTDSLNHASYWLVVICATVLTGFTILQFVAPRRSTEVTRRMTKPPVLVSNWAELTSAGHRYGADSAKVVIVEFSDLECPACRYLNRVALPAVLTRYPGQVAVLYRHWPLKRIHRFAYPAARAAECAGEQNRFQEFASLIFEQQDSLGLKPFDQFARQSGVRDVAAFSACNSREGAVRPVDEDAAVAAKGDWMGTPTVIVNGTLFYATPDSLQLDSIVRADLKVAQQPRRR